MDGLYIFQQLHAIIYISVAMNYLLLTYNSNYRHYSHFENKSQINQYTYIYIYIHTHISTYINYWLHNQLSLPISMFACTYGNMLI